MRVDESIEIEADDICAAAGDILDFLEDTSKEKEIYFKGWDGFGASAALKVVAKMLRSAESMKNPKLKFDRVIHIDCSLWKSRRALQKAIAEELKLPNPVMAVFDQKDRDDDFKGVNEAARREIDDVTKEIFMNLAGCRFVVIFHNGGNEYIDFFEFGIPIYGHLCSKVLWTFHGRFRPHVQVDDEIKETIEKRTDVFLRVVPTGRSSIHESAALSNAVLEEASEVATYLATYKHPTIVLECILHMWAHKYVGGIDWGAHASSYWVCDGIIRGKNPELLLKEKMWEIAGDLHSNIHLDWDLDYVSRAVSYFTWLTPSERWIQILLANITDCQQSSHSFQTIIEKNQPTKATSFFITSNRDKPSTDEQHGFTIHTTRLSSHMFKCYENLRVMQLSWCIFSFLAPPFLYCKKLKFLRLDHCKDLDTNALSDGGEVKDQTAHRTGSLSRPCPDDLWVLHLNHTNINLLWYTGPRMNPRELYFSGVKNWIEHHLHAVQLGELGKLGVTTDLMETFPNLLQAKSLRTITLDGCTELKEVGLDVLPPSLESFTFIVESSTANKKGVEKEKKQAEEEVKGEEGKYSLYPRHVYHKRAQPQRLVARKGEDKGSTANKQGVEKEKKQEEEDVKGEERKKSLYRRRVYHNGAQLQRLMPPLVASKGEDEGGAKVHTISFRSCTQLKGLFLRGWFKKLKMLDLSGTLLKTLDLSMVEAPFLRELRLLGCHMLCAILWPPPAARPRLQELQIDTTGTQLPPSCCLGGTHRLNISVRDGRLLGSLVPIGDHFSDKGLHVDISSSPGHAASYTGSIGDDDDSIIIATSGCSISKKQMVLGRRPGQPYTKDVSFDCTSSSSSTTLLAPSLMIHRDNDNASATVWMWDCPQAPDHGAYIRVEDMMQKTGLVLGPGQGTELLCDHATILHVHDSPSITGIPSPVILSWAKLLWCQVERCQRLDTVFCTPKGEAVGGGSHQALFWYVETLWVSQLPVARHVWSWSVVAQPDKRSFEVLRYVHLDNCPRLLHVLPLSMLVNLGRLHTLEIVCCDSLTEVFPVPAKREVVNFQSLQRLHLHELPALRCLSGRRMVTPELETVRVRGCWSLRQMPAVGGGTGGGWKRKPTVDCEKEWWDQLVWDGVRLGHAPSLYRTLHPRYGREAGLRPGTLLR